MPLTLTEERSYSERGGERVPGKENIRKTCFAILLWRKDCLMWVNLCGDKLEHTQPTPGTLLKVSGPHFLQAEERGLGRQRGKLL